MGQDSLFYGQGVNAIKDTQGSEFWPQFLQCIGFSTGSVSRCLLFTNLDIGRKYEYKCNIEIGGDFFETTKLSSHPY